MAALAFTMVFTMSVGFGVANADPNPADAPTGVNLSLSTGGITVQWTAPINAGTDSSGNPATIASYNVYYGTSPGGESLTPVAQRHRQQRRVN